MATVTIRNGQGLTGKGLVWWDVSDQQTEAVFKFLCGIPEDPSELKKLLEEGTPLKVDVSTVGELALMAWEDRPVVIVGDKSAYAVVSPGGPWKEVERSVIGNSGVPISEEDFSRIFPNADLGTIPTRSAWDTNMSKLDTSTPKLALVPSSPKKQK